MATKKRIVDNEKLSQVNPKTLALWKQYKIDMSLRELSQGSIDGYYNDLTHWWIYIFDHQDNKCITELTDDEITEFLFYCKENGNSSRRIRRRTSAISAFYKFLRRKKIIKDDPTEFISRPKKDTDVITQTFLTQQQVQSIKEQLRYKIRNSKSVSATHTNLQHLCYFVYSMSTMARVTAVSNTRWEQIDFDDRTVNDVIEKEGYVVTLLFSEEVKSVLQELKAFRESHNIDDKGYVFVCLHNQVYDKPNTGTFNKWSKSIGNLIGVPTLHCHDFRHSNATLLKNAGMSLEEVSALLNHQSTDTTLKFYIKADKRRLKEEKDKYEI